MTDIYLRLAALCPLKGQYESASMVSEVSRELLRLRESANVLNTDVSEMKS